MFGKAGAAKAGSEVLEMNDGPRFQVLQRERGGTGYSSHYFCNCKGLIAAFRALQVSWM